MTTGQKVSALSVVAAAVLGIAFTLLVGNRPLLGLDLQGGVSVVLEPTGSADGQEVTDDSLDLTVELLRGRIDAIGVAEPEISRQGQNIVVALPGVVEDQKEALDRLRQTAELRFRPVLFNLGPALDPNAPDPATTDSTEPSTDDSDSSAESTEGSGEGTTTDSSSTTGSTSTSTTDATDEESMAGGGRFGAMLAAQTSSSSSSTTSTTASSSTTAVDDTSTTEGSSSTTEGSSSTTEGSSSTTEADGATPADDTADPDAVPDLADLGALANCLSGELTPDTEDRIDETVILTDRDGFRYCLGPATLDGERLTGDMVETADVGLITGAGWQVNPTLRSGPEGIDKFNGIATLCYNGDPEVCPSRQLAVVLDHEVISAPSINAPTFGRDRIVISGSFTEEEARRLAESLRFGALPLELVAQETRTVSASVGQDVLRSGVIAGSIGLALVAVYLLAYYRLSGLVAIGGLALSAALLWTIVAWFGSQFGLALTLAGVVGLIVAIGVSADSNIVYFENVKDVYRSGRRVSTSVERAYQSAISTIIKADVVSLIAAVLLYLLTVGAVRGFAFYLGLATLLDLLISWLFMRPALSWLASRSAVEANPRLLGLPADGGQMAGRRATPRATSVGGES